MIVENCKEVKLNWKLEKFAASINFEVTELSEELLESVRHGEKLRLNDMQVLEATINDKSWNSNSIEVQVFPDYVQPSASDFIVNQYYANAGDYLIKLSKDCCFIISKEQFKTMHEDIKYIIKWYQHLCLRTENVNWKPIIK